MTDVASYADLIEAMWEKAEELPEEPWDAMHPPAVGLALVGQGCDPEVVADILYPVCDEFDGGLPWAVPWDEAAEVAEDGGPVVTWEGMYDE